MKQFIRCAPIVALVAAFACSPAGSAAEPTRQARTAASARAPAATDFEWHGSVASGDTLRLRNISGRVDVVPAKGSKVRVTAKKTGPDAARVSVAVEERADGVRISAEYPKRGADADVHFTVELPASVALRANVVSGDVVAKNVASKLDLTTVSGDIRVSGSGDLSVNTVSGAAKVTLPASARRAALNAVNGRLEVRLPPGLGVRLDASTLNGRIVSDFEVKRSGGVVGEKATALRGDGAAKVTMESVNGEIRIKKT